MATFIIICPVCDSHDVEIYSTLWHDVVIECKNCGNKQKIDQDE